MQLIKPFITAFLLWIPISMFSQTYYQGDTVFIESCTNCLENHATYGEAETFHTRNIISDFGPRNLPTSFWHGGIDYTAENIEDHGYHILAVEGGTIRRMRAGPGQKYPEILGDSMHLMYNHCFTSASVLENGLREGDLELIRLDFFNNDEYYRYGMLHYRNNDTILLSACPSNNCQLSYKLMNRDTSGYTYDTVSIQPLHIDSMPIITYDTLHPINVVTRNQVIGSLGTSAGTNANSSVASHLHLQRFRNLSGGYGKSNLIDPLERVRHQGPEYQVKVLKNEGQAPNFLEGIELNYPGTSASKFLVRPIMPDEDDNGNINNGFGNNYIYFNNTMNIDQVELKIKNTIDNNFSLIQGASFESKIWLGARFDHDDHYPSASNNNVHVHEGSWTRQTMKPFCYSNRNGRWDDYYFTDFITRIHIEDGMDGGQAQVADCPDQARYPDGRYELYAQVTDVRDSTFYSDTLSFVLDNWKPYIASTDIYIGSSHIYEEEWLCNDDCIEFSNNDLSSDITEEGINQGVSIFVKASEQLASLTLSIPEWNIADQAWLPSISQDDSIHFGFFIPDVDIGGSGTDISLHFTGQDMQDNALISFTEANTNACTHIPHRNTNTTFRDDNTVDLVYGVDSIHGFFIGCAASDSIQGGFDSESRSFDYGTIVSIVSPEIVVTETTTPSYCHPTCDNGSIQIEIENEEDHYIEWSSGETTFELFNLAAGTYYYTITDDFCGYQEGFVDLACNKIEIQFDITPSCDNDGAITANVFGTIPPYSYVWLDDANETSVVRTGLPPGLYTLEVTDANGCTNKAAAYVKDFDAIHLEDMEHTVFDAACNADDGILAIYTPPSGGISPFDYACSNGATGNISLNNSTYIYNFAPGMHAITVTDAAGCSAVQSFEVNVEELSLPGIVKVEHTCEGVADGLIALEFTSNSIDWSNGATGNINTGLVAGQYTYTITNSIGCSRSESITIEVLDENSEPLMAVIDSEYNCPGLGYDNGTLDLAVSGGIPPYSYAWSNGSTSKNISGLSKGDYTVTVTDKCGQSDSFTGYVDAVEIVANSSWELNFGEFTIDTDPMGGAAPYTYSWGSGETTQSITSENGGTHKVTITDANGCEVYEVIEIIYYCHPLAMILEAPPEGIDCATAVTFGFGPVAGNTFPEGTAPFKVKIEKRVDQEWLTEASTILSSTVALNNYEYYTPENGTFRITVIDNCGKLFEEEYYGCLDCNYEFYTGGDNNDKVFVDIFKGMITFEQVCPCDNDCDFLGLTHDKIKLYVDEQAIANSGLFPTLFNFIITWPNDKTTLITMGVDENNPYDVNITGPEDYALSDEEFDNGVSVKVEFNLFENFNVGLLQQCQVEIPFTFGQQGVNGEFFYFEPLDLNPFSNNGVEGPYYLGTGICSTKCEIPLETGVLYAHQPEHLTDFQIECVGDVPDAKNYFRFYPLDWSDPCYGGGYLRTHIETPNGIFINEVFIPANTALAQTYWDLDLPLGGGLSCNASSLNKGFCLFAGIDVYGVEIRRDLIAPFCDDETFVPIVDTDGDGLPDDQDPCPFKFGVFCDDEDDGEEDIPNWDLGSGCVYLFEPDQCMVNIICDQSSTTLTGSISEEFHSGSDPCFHCFSADVCRISNPQGGEDYVSIVGDVNDMLTVAPISNSTPLNCICGYAFYCGEEYSLLGTNCSNVPCTDSGPPPDLLFDVLCRVTNSNNAGGIIALQNEEDFEVALRNVKITKKEALSIIKAKQMQVPLKIEMKSIPNPSREAFELEIFSEYKSNGKVLIHNIVGEILYSKWIDIEKGINKVSLEPQLHQGLYYITLQVKSNTEKSIKHVVY